MKSFKDFIMESSDSDFIKNLGGVKADDRMKEILDIKNMKKSESELNKMISEFAKKYPDNINELYKKVTHEYSLISRKYESDSEKRDKYQDKKDHYELLKKLVYKSMKK